MHCKLIVLVRWSPHTSLAVITFLDWLIRGFKFKIHINSNIPFFVLSNDCGVISMGATALKSIRQLLVLIGRMFCKKNQTNRTRIEEKPFSICVTSQCIFSPRKIIEKIKLRATPKLCIANSLSWYVDHHTQVWPW